MKILVSSHRYAPDVGGIETVSGLLAAEWRRAGHDVRIVTATPLPAGSAEIDPAIHRRPRPLELLRLVRDCDVFWHSHISLQTAWPLLFVRRPWFITVNTWLHEVDGRFSWKSHLKRSAMRHALNLYPSRPLAEHVALPGAPTRNPYDAATFRRIDGIERDAELIFVGRLVSDKGTDLLLRALGELRPRLRPRLTLVGRGPEEEALRTLAASLGVAEQVDFAGYVQGEELARLLNRHRVLVVPSRWAEPFGLVALLGVACGCHVIASNTGGLGEAVGPGGVLFPNGDVDALAREIERGLNQPPAASRDPAAVRAHLAEFEAARVAEAHLAFFRAALAAANR